MSNPRYWALVPAAGSGRRMGSDTPKQYLKLHGRSVLEHTLSRLLAHPDIAGAVVVLAAGDPYWPSIDIASGKPVWHVVGGDERCHSVQNGLQRLAREGGDDDWVLVHDAARPCVRPSDLDRLIQGLRDHPVGGLLALPIHDTIKRADQAQQVVETVPRDGLWRALTPQMFRIGALSAALDRALSDGFLVTDEASAMEHAGHAPCLVEGEPDNLKITRPHDLALAELFLARQAEENHP